MVKQPRKVSTDTDKRDDHGQYISGRTQKKDHYQDKYSCTGWLIVMMKWQDVTHRQTQPFIIEDEARQCGKDVPNCIVLAWIWFIIEYNLTSSHTQLNSIWVNIWSLIRSLYEIETDITLQLWQLEFKYSLSSHIFKPKLKFSLFAQVLSPGILAENSNSPKHI